LLCRRARYYTTLTWHYVATYDTTLQQVIFLPKIPENALLSFLKWALQIHRTRCARAPCAWADQLEVAAIADARHLSANTYTPLSFRKGALQLYHTLHSFNKRALRTHCSLVVAAL